MNSEEYKNNHIKTISGFTPPTGIKMCARCKVKTKEYSYSRPFWCPEDDCHVMELICLECSQQEIDMLNGNF